jgi:Pectate lyase superfamily protein
MPELRRTFCVIFLAAANVLAQQAAQTHLSASEMQLQHVAANPVSKFPRVNILHQDFASGCPNAADPAGQKDSTCAIQAAIDYADSHTVGGQLSALYFPVGNYLISNTLRLPCNLQVLTDGPTASAITLAPNSRSNAITVVRGTSLRT